MINDSNNYPTLIFGAFETGLGVARSLGRFNLDIHCVDYKKDITFYSRYVKAHLFPHPLEETDRLIEKLIEFRQNFALPPVVFITADHYLTFFSENREKFKDLYLFNLAPKEILGSISNKFTLYEKAKQLHIPVPETYKVESTADVNKLYHLKLQYPLIIKGLEVNKWRKNIHNSIKGFRVNDFNELIEKCEFISSKDTPFIIQEIIDGPDTNHFKTCVYYSASGEEILNFTLKKVRQNPIHFGIGAVVESINYPELKELGTKLFKGLDFKGVGSAEFKLDNRDGVLKLIEINPRYWQQNYLPTACGMNFPLINYYDLTNQAITPITDFRSGIKWVNRYSDLASFLDYRREGSLTFREWRKSLRGPKIYSDFSLHDPIPALYEIGFGKKIFSFPKYLYKRLF